MVFLTVNPDDEATARKMYLEKEQFSVPFLVPEGSTGRPLFQKPSGISNEITPLFGQPFIFK
ncbi:hypothetical protein [Chryseobacterium wanjuense]